MKIILIPCSGSKVSGGETTSLPSKLADALSPAAFQKLMSARQELDDILRKDQNRNLGYKDGGEIKYLPAFQRYQGIIYTQGDVFRFYPAFKGYLVIVSALYGLLDGNDLIRNYNLKMDDMLPTRNKVAVFWKRHGLRDILVELIRGENGPEVHDLLSGKYREALSPWPDLIIKNFSLYEYPGMGQGSSYGRAKDLKQLLSQ